MTDAVRGQLVCNPVSFRINKTAGGADDGGGASITLDVSDQERDNAYLLAKRKGQTVAITWQVVEHPIAGSTT